MQGYGIVPGHLKHLDLHEHSGAGGNVDVNIRPDPGHMWVVLALRGYHDDAARACEWLGTIDGTTFVLSGVTIASGTDSQFYSTFIPGVPITITRDCFLVWKVNSMAGGKISTLKGLVSEISGVQNVI